MTWIEYLIVAAIFATLFFGGAVYALYWSSRNGQLERFEDGSRVIFDEEEPEGVTQDQFPGGKARSTSDA